MIPNDQEPFFYKMSKSNTWLFSVSSFTSAVVVRLNTNQHNSGDPIMLSGSGILHIPFGCKVTGSTFHSHASENWESEETEKVIQFFTSKVKTVFSKQDTQFFKQIEKDPEKNAKFQKILKDTAALDSHAIDGMRIKDIKDKLENIKIGKTSFNVNHFSTIMVTLISVPILIAIIGIVVVKKYFFSKPPTK